MSSPESQGDSRAIQENENLDSPRILFENSGNDKPEKILPLATGGVRGGGTQAENKKHNDFVRF